MKDCNHFILEEISYVLHHNYFLLNEKWYLQKQGASMGARFLPTYANVYMGWWEEQRIYNAHNLHRDHIISYFCYIDDLIFIVDCNLSAYALNLKFTLEEHQVESRDQLS